MFFGDASANRTAVWAPPPDHRGSFQILSSCLVTLGLCVWTAIHLNMPEHEPRRPKRSSWNPRAWLTSQTLRKIGWLILGLLAPEMVVFTAWAQQRSARYLTKLMGPYWKHAQQDTTTGTKNLGKAEPQREVELGPAGQPTGDGEQSKAEEIPIKPFAWTNTHSFFAKMGGFAIDTSELPAGKKYLPGNRERVVLSPGVLLYLAEHEPDLLPNISKADINDKSKASGLAKTLVCIQATWFCIQCIYRVALGASVSLLELSTFGHAICALLMYWLWWDKPLDVEQPVLITSQRAHYLCAAFCFDCWFSGLKDSLNIQFRLDHLLYPRLRGIGSFNASNRKYETEHLPLEIDNLKLESSIKRTHSIQVLNSIQSESSLCREENWHALRKALQIASKGSQTESPSEVASARARVTIPSYLESAIPEPPKQCDHREWNRWFMALSTKSLHSDDALIYFEERWCIETERLKVYDRMTNRPFDFNFDDLVFDLSQLHPFPSHQKDGDILVIAFITSGALYGGLHLLAWNAPFTSHTQQLLWRISGTAVAAFGVALLVLFWGASAEVAIRDRCQQYLIKEPKQPGRRLLYWMGRIWRWSSVLTIICLLVTGPIFYLFARTFLIIECFISLAYLPESVFKQPKWVGYFPHIQ